MFQVEGDLESQGSWDGGWEGAGLVTSGVQVVPQQGVGKYHARHHHLSGRMQAFLGGVAALVVVFVVA